LVLRKICEEQFKFVWFLDSPVSPHSLEIVLIAQLLAHSSSKLSQYFAPVLCLKDFFNWEFDQPNGDGNCISVIDFSDNNAWGMWNDQDCNEINFAICKMAGSEFAFGNVLFIKSVALVQWFLTFSTYLTPFYQTRLSDLSPIHSMVLFFKNMKLPTLTA